jgi:cobalamin biosynthesis protein CobT
MHAAGVELLARPEARKVLMLMIDGGTGRHEQTAKEVAMLKRRGVVTIAIGIAHEPEGYEHAVNVQDLNDLGGAAFRKLCDVVARETAGA